MSHFDSAAMRDSMDSGFHVILTDDVDQHTDATHSLSCGKQFLRRFQNRVTQHPWYISMILCALFLGMAAALLNVYRPDLGTAALAIPLWLLILHLALCFLSPVLAVLLWKIALKLIQVWATCCVSRRTTGASSFRTMGESNSTTRFLFYMTASRPQTVRLIYALLMWISWQYVVGRDIPNGVKSNGTAFFWINGIHLLFIIVASGYLIATLIQTKISFDFNIRAFEDKIFDCLMDEYNLMKLMGKPLDTQQSLYLLQAEELSHLKRSGDRSFAQTLPTILQNLSLYTRSRSLVHIVRSTLVASHSIADLGSFNGVIKDCTRVVFDNLYRNGLRPRLEKKYGIKIGSKNPLMPENPGNSGIATAKLKRSKSEATIETLDEEEEDDEERSLADRITERAGDNTKAEQGADDSTLSSSLSPRRSDDASVASPDVNRSNSASLHHESRRNDAPTSDQTGFITQEGTSSTQEGTSSTQQVASPTQQVASPIQQVASPTQNVASPTQETEASTQEVDSVHPQQDQVPPPEPKPTNTPSATNDSKQGHEANAQNDKRPTSFALPQESDVQDKQLRTSDKDILQNDDYTDVYPYMSKPSGTNVSKRFISFKREDVEFYLYLLEESGIGAVNEQDVDRLWARLSNGIHSIQKDQLKSAIESMFNERMNLSSTLLDARRVVEHLETAILVVVGFLMIFPVLTIFGVDVLQLWVGFSSIALAFTFIFGNSGKELFEAIIFLFVVHPFDVGDLIKLQGSKGEVLYKVTKMELMTTQLLRWDGALVKFENFKLSKEKMIVNLSTSELHKADHEFFLDTDCLDETLVNDLQAAMDRYTQQFPLIYLGTQIAAKGYDKMYKTVVVIRVMFAYPNTSPPKTRADQSNVLLRFGEELTARGCRFTSVDASRLPESMTKQ